MSEDQQKGESPAFQRLVDRLMEAIRQFATEITSPAMTTDPRQNGSSSSSALGGLPEILGGGGELP